jgi:anaerobic selenocysteine-containing dehydrogenase
MCSRNCPLEADVKDGKVVRVRGAVCPRGQANLDLLYHNDRILTPLARAGGRRNGKFMPVGWDEALEGISDRLKHIRAQYGPESVVFFAGYIKEPRPWLKRLAMAFGTPNYMTESSTCYAASSVAARLNFGCEKFGVHDVGPDPLTRTHVLWATNPEHSLIPTVGAIYDRQRTGMKLVVVDCRKTHTASRADLHLQPHPGTDGALALAVLKVLFEGGMYDHEFTGRYIHGLGEIRAHLSGLSLAGLSTSCGVPEDLIISFAGLVFGNSPTKIQTSVASLLHHVNGVQTFRAVSLISAVSGNLDVTGGNLLWPGGVRLKDVTMTERLESLPPRVGADRFPVWAEIYPEAQAMALPGQTISGTPYPIKAFVGIGPNLMMWPDSTRMARALESLDLVVVADYFHTPTTALADYVLPAATHFERTAVVMRDDGHVRLRQAVIEPLGQSRPDWQIIFDLGHHLGLAETFWNGSLKAGIDEWLSPSGTTYEELASHPEGLKLEVPPNSPRKYLRAGFATPSGKVEAYSTILARHGFEPLPVWEPEPCAATPATPGSGTSVTLISGTRQPSYTHSQGRNIARLRSQQPDPLVSINPDDAAELEIQEDSRVEIATEKGSVIMKARVTREVPRGLISAPHGWAESDINRVLDGEVLDPISGFPCFKGQRCTIRLAGNAQQAKQDSI